MSSQTDTGRVLTAAAGFFGGVLAYHLISKRLSAASETLTLPLTETLTLHAHGDVAAVSAEWGDLQKHAAIGRSFMKTAVPPAAPAKATGAKAACLGGADAFQVPGEQPFSLVLQLEHDDGSDPSALELAQDKFKIAAYNMAQQLAQRALELATPRLDADTRLESLTHHPTAFTEKLCGTCNGFADALFVGHKAVDLDSVASAVAAAQLYGGTACRADGGTRDQRGPSIASATCWRFPTVFRSACVRGLR